MWREVPVDTISAGGMHAEKNRTIETGPVMIRYLFFPQHFLYFFPLPHGQGSLG